MTELLVPYLTVRFALDARILVLYVLGAALPS